MQLWCLAAILKLSLFILMEEAAGDERELNALIFKNSVEGLLQKIEEIAEQKPEEVEICEENIFDFNKQFVNKLLF